MKRLLFLLLATSYICSMEQPNAPALLTAIPFEADTIKLTSFAESMVLGKLMIGTQTSAGKNSIYLAFNDYRNPELTYRATQEEAWNATRYIVASQLKELIEIEHNLSDFNNCPPEDLNKSKKHHAEQLERYHTALASLNVSETLPILPRILGAAEAKLKKELETQIALAPISIIETLKSFKQAPTILRGLAFDRFYHFWSYQDLQPQTVKDRTQRNFAQVKEQRTAFFAALENNDTETLIQFSEKMKSIVPKEKLTTLEGIDKMIRRVEQNKHLNAGSPQNSDDELW